MARKSYSAKSPPPYLKRVQLLPERRGAGYPFDLPWLGDDFELTFTAPITVIVGENGTGKSTMIEALAAVAGFGQGGGNRDHGGAAQDGASALAGALRAGWLPKITTGWFFRAETFFGLSRYLDDTGSPAADFLAHSHGEGFMRVFTERMSRQGLYLMDEPESALSPKRQLGLLRLLDRLNRDQTAQVIMATHSPILMATPGADLRHITHRGIFPCSYRDTEHFRLYQSFANDPDGFLKSALAGDWDAIT